MGVRDSLLRIPSQDSLSGNLSVSPFLVCSFSLNEGQDFLNFWTLDFFLIILPALSGTGVPQDPWGTGDEGCRPCKERREGPH